MGAPTTFDPEVDYYIEVDGDDNTMRLIDPSGAVVAARDNAIDYYDEDFDARSLAAEFGIHPEDVVDHWSDVRWGSHGYCQDWTLVVQFARDADARPIRFQVIAALFGLWMGEPAWA
jgi:hypothetical protein